MFDNAQNNKEEEVLAPQSSDSIMNKDVASGKLAEDIFANTDDSVVPGAMPQATRFPSEAMPGQKQVMEDLDGSGSGLIKKAAVVVAGILVLAAIGYGGFWAYGKFFSGNDEQAPANGSGAEDLTADNGGLEEADGEGTGDDNIIQDEPQIATSVPRLSEPDSDQDGLTDDEEAGLGSDPMNIDSDNDGLFDREEAKVYKTEINNPDTDGDGYTDGDEVKGGYNPLGPGKLYQAAQ